MSSIGNLKIIKTDIFLRVKLMFDAPSSSVVVGVINDQIREFEWRLQTRAEFNV